MLFHLGNASHYDAKNLTFAPSWYISSRFYHLFILKGLGSDSRDENYEFLFQIWNLLWDDINIRTLASEISNGYLRKMVAEGKQACLPLERAGRRAALSHVSTWKFAYFSENVAKASSKTLLKLATFAHMKERLWGCKSLYFLVVMNEFCRFVTSI